jgi:hypothetical protein
LIKRSETRATRLDMVWPKMVEIDLKFDALVTSRHEYAPLFKTCLALRMHKTDDLGQLLLAFIPTPHGLQWYRSPPDSSPEEMSTMSKNAARQHVSELRRFFRVKFGSDPEVGDIVSEYDRTQESSESAGTVMEFWDRKLGARIQSPFRARPRLVPSLFFAEMSICMTQLPCPESSISPDNLDRERRLRETKYHHAMFTRSRSHCS